MDWTPDGGLSVTSGLFFVSMNFGLTFACCCIWSLGLTIVLTLERDPTELDALVWLRYCRDEVFSNFEQNARIYPKPQTLKHPKPVTFVSKPAKAEHTYFGSSRFTRGVFL